jgi:hypothetical protein
MIKESLFAGGINENFTKVYVVCSHIFLPIEFRMARG